MEAQRNGDPQPDLHQRETRAWQAVVPKNLLKAKDNKLTATLSDGDATGSINFGDIVLTYTQKA